MNLYYETNSLQHHGIKGQRWGVRRFQNKDGSLTALGEKRAAKKSPADKKAAEDLKTQRSTRRLNALKQIQQMRQEALDRAANRKLARENTKLERERLKNETLEKAANRKLAKEQQRLNEKNQKQDALDRKNSRELAKKEFDLKRDVMKPKDNNKPNTSDDYYELPDTPERQKSSASNGKKIALGALTAVGTVAAVAAARKYGPDIVSRIKNSNFGKTVKDAASDPDKRDFVMEIFREASSYRNNNSPSTNPVSNAIATVGNIPLLAAPNDR